MKLFKIFIFLFLFFLSLTTYVFFNIGHYLDITEVPKKSDIIVSLGGGSIERIENSIQLFNKNYSTKSLLILTGDDRSKKEKESQIDDKRINYIKKEKNKDINIIHNPNLKSTEEEIIYIKNFMNKNHFKSAMIISDPPHSRRISILINSLTQNDKLTFNLAKTESSWWNKNGYYKEKRSFRFVIREIFKIIYTYITYDFFYKLGLKEYLDRLKPYIYPIQTEIEKKLVLFIN